MKQTKISLPVHNILVISILLSLCGCKYKSYQRAKELEEVDKAREAETHTSLKEYYLTKDSLLDLPVVRFNFDIDKPLQEHPMYVALPKIMHQFRKKEIELDLPRHTFLAQNTFFLNQDSVETYYQKVKITDELNYYLVSNIKQEKLFERKN